MENVYDRIVELAKEQNLNIHALEKKLGIYNGGISRIKYYKEQTISKRVLKLVCDYFDVPEEYILYGITKNLATTPKDYKIISDSFETILIENYRQLNDRDKVLALAYITNLIKGEE